MSNTQRQPGTLVHYRKRDWMVLPSDDKDILRIKPLGGSEEEETAVYLPITLQNEQITKANFDDPKPHEIGAFETARILFDASRLSFRNAAGPFRCMGKLSFRPRAYQLVPLVMALKQETVRLMIADDVGIGKTVEALIILKELMERGEIKKFAVICPPHLCEQWQGELKDKLDIDAEIIRSSTAAKLDRKIPDDQSVFYHVPFQVISVDYIKSDRRRGIFINDCPELIIVDEAHTCALPEGAKSKSQQQRHALLHDLAEKKDRNILLLTATPHSGKDGEFTSLLGLLKPKFGQLKFDTIDQNDRRKLARHFVQRKRENIKRWLKEKTEFPDRDSLEIGYALSPEYQMFYHNLIRFARGISSKKTDNKQTQLLRSWAAIALIKGAMSSPIMAIEMLERRKDKILASEETTEAPSLEDTLFEDLEHISDIPRQDLIESIDFENEELNDLESLQKEAVLLQQDQLDRKIETTIKYVKQLIKEDLDPIVFCHYIATANYVADRLKKELPKSIHIEAITSELADEQRKERIEIMGKAEKRVLVATDCLSEGINLQEHFTAVLHYDLPWNPNRLEQRIGRVDRFGQTSPIIKNYILYGEDNDMDTFVLEVLIKKVVEIQKSTGVSIAIGENSKSVMAEAAKHLLFDEGKSEGKQQKLFAEETVTNELDLARKKGENLRSIFAHESIDPETIKKDLDEVDEAIGDDKTVAQFVRSAVQQLGGNCEWDGKSGYNLQAQNLPPHIRRFFNTEKLTKISFVSPTPKGYIYVGRNHQFVEQLCQFLLAIAFEPHPEYGRLARVSEIQTDVVNTKTTLVMFRVRNVIKEVASKKEAIAEEMYLWGYQSVNGNMEVLDYTTAKNLMTTAKSLTNLSKERQQEDLEAELKNFETMKSQFIDLANERAEKLVEAHGRFKELVGGRRYEKATPVLPPDVMGVYILMPKPKSL
ncbi:SNF2 family N-terminal domain-containing protein [Hyunsoonleella jejuensis]|uniref:SNF2 family N-terminal domain-containing protein n=1 Tax=Hyunsoonleella jejuensis TaxID=419940 RepID=A0A1H9CPL5_9FLAO|nr:helicase-related protein [Hyunsoonleella jejuensis]SEQ03150.1 SNF2 family N-terminal domain-containing protein [Hyunsoonleella jejuensis]